MKKDLHKKLKDKGWTEEEIEHALEKMLKSKKSPLILLLDKVAYWVALFILIFGNFLISVFLIPFLVITKGFVLYFILFVFAFIFGLLYDLLIRDIDKLDMDHKIMAGIFIPALALINIYIIVGVSNHVIEIFDQGSYNNPLSISFVYVVSFIIPYIYSEIKEKIR
ncbi:hypothetical protein C0585_01735 [Candidatus Woesearchaeota archaeon]|nr:MAG: hypothetical protein C0585_01735 [Candidatus Woesearchaeota archaeon]